MNRIATHLGFLLFIPIFFSCEEKSVDYGLGEYYKEVVTALAEDYSYQLDNGKTLFEANPPKNTPYEEGKRIALYSTTSNHENKIYSLNY